MLRYINTMAHSSTIVRRLTNTWSFGFWAVIRRVEDIVALLFIHGCQDSLVLLQLVCRHWLLS